MMSGLGERKFWIVHAVLVIILIIGFVFASGCLDFFKSFGGTKTGAQTTLTPTGTPAKDITQVTQALETPGPGAGGGAGGSGKNCCARTVMSIVKSQPKDQEIDLSISITTSIDSPLMKRTVTSDCPQIDFLDFEGYKAAHKREADIAKAAGSPPDPEWQKAVDDLVWGIDYRLEGTMTADKVTGKVEKEIDKEGQEIGGDLIGDFTFNLVLYDAQHDAVVKEAKVSWSGRSRDFARRPSADQPTVNDISSMVDSEFGNLDQILLDYERMPVSAQIKPVKDEVNAGETIDVTVKNLNDDKGRSPQPFQRVLVKADHGKILGGTQAGKYKVFKPGSSSFTFQYKAPDDCDKATSDTIMIYNSCDIADKVQPLASTTLKSQIGTKTINIKCEGGEGYIDYSCYFTTPRYFYYSEEWVKGTIPFTIEVVGKNNKWLTGNNTISYKKKIYWNPNEKDGCIWTYEGKTRALIWWDNDPESEEGKSGIWATYPPREDNSLFYGHYANAEPGPIKQEMPACRLRNTLNDITDVSNPDLQTKCVQLGGYIQSREWGTIPFQDGAEISRKDSIGIGEAETHIILHLKNKK